MLNELESLSGNIGRLIQISERHNQARAALEAQLEQMRTDFANVQAELVQMRQERDALQNERDSLSAKIDDAQVRLNAILEKLPRGKSAQHADADNQLDLLDAESTAHEHEHAHAEMNGEHHHGEKA
ncbi:Chromosome segregation ATPase [Candidatus Burkholderia verschuerenii]|uniref:Chromosome segregation ATPase n=1 Tax=Candidatus Burkholderia verschuerenii TaxID=242163 RepID=A0A0L0MDR9_9BURK|nr:ATPase [Candidatus Burkholderia verschuerenii]KND60446.1 Chromosome segregation ATPase [Candidatus Burkholderia verschuerenii]